VIVKTVIRYDPFDVDARRARRVLRRIRGGAITLRGQTRIEPDQLPRFDRQFHRPPAQGVFDATAAASTISTAQPLGIIITPRVNTCHPRMF
jgi:hypothetical protein